MSKTTDYLQGQHQERQRTMRLIGDARRGCGVGGNTALDRLVMMIASEPLTLPCNPILPRDDGKTFHVFDVNQRYCTNCGMFRSELLYK